MFRVKSHTNVIAFCNLSDSATSPSQKKPTNPYATFFLYIEKTHALPKYQDEDKGKHHATPNKWRMGKQDMAGL